MFSAVQHYKGTFSRFCHDTRDSVALAKEVWYQYHLETLQAHLRTSHQLSVRFSHDSAGMRDDWLQSNVCYFLLSIRLNLFNKIQPRSQFFERIREACYFPPALSLSPTSFKRKVTDILSTE